MTEAVFTTGHDIVEQVATKGHFSGQGHEHKESSMNSTKQTARIAGVLYLINAVTGFFGIIYVPSKLIYPVTRLQPPKTSSVPRGFSVSVWLSN